MTLRPGSRDASRGPTIAETEGGAAVDRRNLAVAFEAHVLADPTATALVVGDARWSRAEIADLANRVTGLLVGLDARPGDAVVSQYHTEAADIAVALAAARLGCTFVPIPVRLGPLEFNHVLELVDPALLVLRDVALAAQLDVPTRTAVRSSEDVVSGGPVAVAFADEPPGHVPVIGFTSGSTGRPKGVMHGWAQMSWVRQFLADLVELRPGEAICVTGAGRRRPRLHVLHVPRSGLGRADRAGGESGTRVKCFA